MDTSSTLSNQKATNSASSGGKCAHCLQQAKLRCANCLKVGQEVFYCNKDCQTKDWKDHKRLCALPPLTPKPTTDNNNASACEVFSRKVFLGGLPLSVKEQEIKQHFVKFGPLLVEFESRPEESYNFKKAKHNGYVFLIYDDESSVHQLLRECNHPDDHYYMYLSGPTFHEKQIEIRPWRLSDSQYMPDPSSPADPRSTIYIGELPRPTKASELAQILAEMFGPVKYVEINVDAELKYPKGSARINFNLYKSYVAAMERRSVVIPHYSGGQKTVEIQPYTVKDHKCDQCMGKQCQYHPAPYFCADMGCLQYYCEFCWRQLHYGPDVNPNRRYHQPFVKLGEQI